MPTGDVRHDDIVVGAGSAGAALAARLTGYGRTRVLLLEAGRASHPQSFLPVSFSLLIDEPTANWRYLSEPEAGAADRVDSTGASGRTAESATRGPCFETPAAPAPRHEVVGGCSERETSS